MLTTSKDMSIRDVLVQTGDKELLADYDKKAPLLERLARCDPSALPSAEDRGAAEAMGLNYTGPGSAAFGVVGIFGVVTTMINFENGPTKKHLAYMAMTGFGTAISWGRGWFSVPPHELKWGCGAWITATPVTCTIGFWRNGQYLGQFVGGGFGTSGAAGVGYGNWD